MNQQGSLPFSMVSTYTSPPGTTVASVSWKLGVQVEVSSFLLTFLDSPSHLSPLTSLQGPFAPHSELTLSPMFTAEIKNS